MLRELSGVFADNPKCPSIDKGVKHKIDTGDAQPIKQRIYPGAPAVEEETMTQVTEMISNGICRPSNSPWRAESCWCLSVMVTEGFGSAFVN